MPHGPYRAWLAGLIAGLIAVVIGGCAGGEATPPGWSARTDITGSISTPRYELTAEENAWDCPRLTGAIEQGLPDLARLTERARAERQGPPPSLTRAVARAVGQPSDGYPVEAEFLRARDRLSRYNSTLGERGCDRVDIEQRLGEFKPERPPLTMPGNDLQSAVERPIDQQSGVSNDLRL